VALRERRSLENELALEQSWLRRANDERNEQREQNLDAHERVVAVDVRRLYLKVRAQRDLPKKWTG
jgi:hypothetical protein